jgi:MarR family transcriptional regulator, 2-MHQ and catechol-resistance regulon repressor
VLLAEKHENTKAVHIWLVLWKAYRVVFEAATAQIKGLCLGDSDFRVLEVLLHKGPLPVNTIGPKVELTPGSISVAVDRLEKRGFVTRRLDPVDRRIHVVHLTAEGQSIIRKAFAHHEREMEQLFLGLSQQERTTLVVLLKKLGKSVEAKMQVCQRSEKPK